MSANGEQAQAVLFTLGGLPSGTHTLAIEATRTDSAAHIQTESLYHWLRQAFDLAQASLPARGMCSFPMEKRWCPWRDSNTRHAV